MNKEVKAPIQPPELSYKETLELASRRVSWRSCPSGRDYLSNYVNPHWCMVDLPCPYHPITQIGHLCLCLC
jgi:hypothetical protein